ncbi:cytochrome c550 [Paenisporosarcina sp. OV554]|uniref:cytochrome c550 n=1 Tax=Paenisporosarcina sp. OV554 TaxID=2135694 RepID=UPI000D35D508|nr:cytochrome c [Paenisporosarcina sp. OV554]PUB12549.1 cytochrome c550 [Paenisporosarcina sp. OV554]
MQKNPIVPFILIMAFGIGLIFFLSIQGVDKKKEIAAGHEEGAAGEQAEGGESAEGFDPEAVAQGKCIACHGGDLAGQGSFPSLVDTKLSTEEIAEVIKNGRGAMPPGLVPAANVDEMAEYIHSLE